MFEIDWEKLGMMALQGIAAVFLPIPTLLVEAFGDELEGAFEDLGNISFDNFISGLREYDLNGKMRSGAERFGAAISDGLKNFIDLFSDAPLAQKFGANISDGWKGFIDGLAGIFGGLDLKILSAFENAWDVIQDQAGEIGKDIAVAFKESVKGAARSLSPGGLARNLRKAIGLESGGTVPQGFPNDTFPAALTSGEMVIPRDDVGKLRNFLESNQGGGATANDATINLLSQILVALQKPIVTQADLRVDQRKFGDMILELSRNNRRIA
jgi:hypothetical protein